MCLRSSDKHAPPFVFCQERQAKHFVMCLCLVLMKLKNNYLCSCELGLLQGFSAARTVTLDWPDATDTLSLRLPGSVCPWQIVAPQISHSCCSQHVKALCHFPRMVTRRLPAMLIPAQAYFPQSYFTG